jgi:hypothetical protein
LVSEVPKKQWNGAVLGCAGAKAKSEKYLPLILKSVSKKIKMKEFILFRDNLQMC